MLACAVKHTLQPTHSTARFDAALRSLCIWNPGCVLFTLALCAKTATSSHLLRLLHLHTCTLCQDCYIFTLALCAKTATSSHLPRLLHLHNSTLCQDCYIFTLALCAKTDTWSPSPTISSPRLSPPFLNPCLSPPPSPPACSRCSLQAKHSQNAIMWLLLLVCLVVSDVGGCVLSTPAATDSGAILVHGHEHDRPVLCAS